MLHELRAWLNRSGCGGQLAYWRTPSGSEVDFVWSRGAAVVGIEAKAATRWRRGDGAPLAQLHTDKKLRRAFGVYLGREALRDGPIHVLPLRQFLDQLEAGRVLG